MTSFRHWETLKHWNTVERNEQQNFKCKVAGINLLFKIPELSLDKQSRFAQPVTIYIQGKSIENVITCDVQR